MYGDLIVEDEEKLHSPKQIDSLSIGMLPPEIQKLQYRVQCAINLRNLYYRLRLYNLIVAKQQNKLPMKDVIIYPNSTDWCDALISIGYFPKSVIRVFLTSQRLRKPRVCPSIGDGKSTYAMNSNCELYRRVIWCFCSRLKPAGINTVDLSFSLLIITIQEEAVFC